MSQKGAVPESNDYQIYETKVCGIIELIVKYSKYTKHPKGPEIMPRAHESKDDGTQGIESAPREKTN